MTRFRATLIHLLLVTAVLAAIVAVVLLNWYPAPTFRISNALKLVLLLIGINLVGPLLTLIVYRHGKAGMTFDLVVIGLLQAGALAFGTYALYADRPGHLVFAVDRFNLVAHRSVDLSAIGNDELGDASAFGMQLIFARMPEDPDERQALLQNVMFNNAPDLELRPDYWEPYASGAETVRAAIKPIDDVVPANEAEAAAVGSARARYQGRYENLGLVPIGVLDEDIAMLIDIDTLQPVDIVEVDIWKIGGVDRMPEQR